MHEGEFKTWFRRPSLFAANAMLLLAASATFWIPPLTALLMRALSLLIPSLGQVPSGSVASALYTVGAVAAPSVLYAVARPGVSQSMRLGPLEPYCALCAFGAGVVGALFANQLSVLWSMLLQALGCELSASAEAAGDARELTALVIAAGVVPGVCEELLFRGTLLGAWERRGTGYAICVSSALFCAMHGSVEGLPAQIVMGFVIGYAVTASDSLYAGMVLHTVYNSTMLLMSFIGERTQTLTSVGEAGNLYEAVGGLGGTALLALQTLMLGALLGAVMLLFASRAQRRESPFEARRKPDRKPLDWRETLVLCVALLTLGARYVLNFLTLIGVKV